MALIANARAVVEARRLRRQLRVRNRLFGSSARPRLAVFRSSKHIYAQLINDETASTLAQASTRDAEGKALVGPKGGNVAAAALIGKLVAERALAAGISKVCFDRRGYRYHGRVKALADAARAAGLQF